MLTPVKLGTLGAIAYNLADSLGSGIGMLIGVCEMDAFGEAARSPEGFVRIDFFTGKVTHGVVSPSLTEAIAKYRAALPALCAKHGASIEGFRELSAHSACSMSAEHQVCRSIGPCALRP
jgi:hypothetical protein